MRVEHCKRGNQRGTRWTLSHFDSHDEMYDADLQEGLGQLHAGLARRATIKPPGRRLRLELGPIQLICQG
jgi:hypothetical protein